MEEDIALEWHFKPIVELSKQIVENTVGEKSDVESGENETFFFGRRRVKIQAKTFKLIIWQFSNSDF